MVMGGGGWLLRVRDGKEAAAVLNLRLRLSRVGSGGGGGGACSASLLSLLEAASESASHSSSSGFVASAAAAAERRLTRAAWKLPATSSSSARGRELVRTDETSALPAPSMRSVVVVDRVYFSH